MYRGPTQILTVLADMRINVIQEVHADSALKMRKWFPNSFEFLCLHIHIKRPYGTIVISKNDSQVLRKLFIRNLVYYIIFFLKTPKLFKLKSVPMDKKCIFHFLIPLKNLQISKRIVTCETFLLLKRWVIDPSVECTKKYLSLLTFFGQF